MAHLSENPGDIAGELEKCEADPVYWMNTYVYFADPHADDPRFRRLPLVLWPAQIELTEFLIEGREQSRDRIVNKSRKVGASWVAVALCVHGILFENGFTARVGHRKEEEAVGPSVDCLMGKARYILENVPTWMKPVPAELHVANRIIQNKSNGSEMKGESLNSNFGRGARPTVMLMDEAAHADPETQQKLMLATESAAKSKWRISTPNGKGNAFHLDYEAAGQGDRLEISWRSDPRRTQEWYDSRLRENGGNMSWDAREQELGCNFSAVTGIRVFRWNDDFVVSDDDIFDLVGWRRFRSDEWVRTAGMDFGSGASLTVYVEAFCLYGEKGDLEHVVIPRSNYWSRTPVGDIGREIVGNQRSLYGGKFKVWGDPSGAYKDKRQSSWVKDLKAVGVRAKALDNWYNTADGQGRIIEYTQDMLDSGKLLIHESNVRLIEDLQTWIYDLPAGLAPEMANRAYIKPRKDGPSHGCQALTYVCGYIHKKMSRSPRFLAQAAGGFDLPW